jgi:hypothetical protein
MTVIPNSIHARDVAYLLHPNTNARRHEKTGPIVIDRSKSTSAPRMAATQAPPQFLQHPRARRARSASLKNQAAGAALVVEDRPDAFGLDDRPR